MAGVAEVTRQGRGPAAKEEVDEGRREGRRVGQVARAVGHARGRAGTCAQGMKHIQDMPPKCPNQKGCSRGRACARARGRLCARSKICTRHAQKMSKSDSQTRKIRMQNDKKLNLFNFISHIISIINCFKFTIYA